MKRVILSEKVPIKAWLDSIDERTMEQTVHLAMHIPDTECLLVEYWQLME